MKINNAPRSFVKKNILISPALPHTPTLYRITLFNIPISTTKIIPNNIIYTLREVKQTQDNW